MTRGGGAAAGVTAGGARSVAAGEIRDSVVLTGDRTSVNVSVGLEEGALLELLRRAAAPAARPLPLANAPSAFANHVDRASEAATILAALAVRRSVELHGEPGIGKTYVLTDVGNRPDTADADGVAYVYADGARLEDVLQLLYEEFYDCEEPARRPSPSRLRRELADRRALVLVDGLDLPPDGVQALVAAAPGCRFLLVSPARRLGDGKSIALGGLDAEFALALVEQELERPLAPDERGPAEAVCAALTGHPWRIRSAVSAARDRGQSLAELAEELGSAGPPDPLAELSADERRVLSVLASLGGASLGVEHLRALAGVADLEGVLGRLERRHAIQAHSPRFSLAGDLAAGAERWASDADRERALGHFVARGEAGGPDGLAAEAPALVALLHWAERSGRDEDAIRLGRAVDAPLVAGRRFGAWGEAIETALEAASRANRGRDVAWALHQRGTREFALGRPDAARAALEQALELRERAGDDAAAEVTRQNLRVVAGAAPPGWLGRVGRLPTFLAVLVAALAIGVGGVAALRALDEGDGGTVTVPNVVGLTEELAVTTLEAAGLGAEVGRAASEDVAEGVVTAQSPEAGATLDEGEVVSIVVSTGAGPPPPPPPTTVESVVVPDVVGLSEADAVLELENAGLAPERTEVEGNEETHGKVVEQDPAAGTEVARDSVVRLSVAEGPADLAVEIVDVRIVEGDPETGCGESGCSTTVVFAIENLGPAELTDAFGASIEAVWTATNATTNVTEMRPGLAPGAPVQTEVTFAGPCPSPTTCDITVTLDPGESVRDSNRENNTDQRLAIRITRR